MIYLAVDSCCHGCHYFKVEDIVNVAGDHILMCSRRQECWEKRQAYAKGCCEDICGTGLTGLGDCE